LTPTAPGFGNDCARNHHAFSFEVGRGETLGEVSLFAGVTSQTLGSGPSGVPDFDDTQAAASRTYTAVCVRDTRVVKISRGAFLHIVRQYPTVMIRFTQV